MDPYFRYPKPFIVDTTRETFGDPSRFQPITVDWDDPDWHRDYYGYRNMGYPVQTVFSFTDSAFLAALRISRS